MNVKAEKFTNLLKEIFEVDKSDLDFGIYRIINHKRDAINKFINDELVNEVKMNIENFNDGNIIQEDKVYNHLINFFSRYYEDGDFISKRRYKEGVYAIPYEGEEVKLYWANNDQYYIKSSENFTDYTFKVGEYRIHFKLVEANVELNNNNSLEKNRMFILDNSEDNVELLNNELIIKFNYTGVPKGTKQAKLNIEISNEITKKLTTDPKYREYLIGLQQLDLSTDKKLTILDKELTSYTSKNSFDYFIHKDLGAFLKRELDFYIKNEILSIDTIGSSEEKNILDYINEIKIIKNISYKIIQFLEHVENYQKKLWLKKKFIIQSNYCITLDKIPKKLYSEILENEEQINKWIEIIGENIVVDEVFLENNQFLLLDTKYYSDDFKDRIIAGLSDLDNITDGLLIHSDNFQALRVLENKYENNIKCCYIDPPYNTNASKIIYKNGYEHSSWITLMNDRLIEAKKLLSDDGVIEVAIDDYEFRYLNLTLESIFGIDNFISNIAILTNPKGRDQEFIAQAHDYNIIYAKDKRMAKTNYFELTPEEMGKKYALNDGGEAYRELPLKRTGSEKFRENRPYMFFPFIYFRESKELQVLEKEEYIKIYCKETNSFNDEYLISLRKKYEAKGAEFILPVDESGAYLRWRWGYDSCLKGVKEGIIIAKETQKNTINIYEKNMGDKYVTPKSLWIGERYDASSKGTNLLKNMIPNNPFDYPKSLYTVIDSLTIGSNEDSTIIDFFAGSGTTGHAVIELNRISGNRKYILIEMGEYFDIVTKPRIERAIYSKEWKNGKPIDKEGVSHIFKYIELEQYEDTLNNIEFKDNMQLDFLSKDNKEDYFLSYMLDFETKDSNTFLNIDKLKNPFEYKLKIERNGESQYRNIDLIETFNYLIGLKVEEISRKETYSYDGFELEKYFDGTFAFKRIEGKLKDGSNVLIVWRNLSDNIKIDNDVLNKYFKQKHIETSEYDYIYINGDNTIEIDGRDNYKIKLIDEEFKRLMFEDIE